tara:strand:- start:154 stop:378 length:225 start_codon:yes stop_codon:yes gene_type:complete
MKALLAASLVFLPAFTEGESKAISNYNANKILNKVSPVIINPKWNSSSPGYISADESIRNKINDINPYKSRYQI